MSRQKAEGVCSVKSGDIAIVAFLLIGFVCLLNYYGYALLPFWIDETTFLQPAENLMKGQGMGTPSLDSLLPGIDKRTYWQPPVYFLALGAWGKLVGFDVISSRWLSRFWGATVLLLLWILAQRWGVPRSLALMCVTWCALDLPFQYNSNLGRMDTLNALLLLGSLLSFTSYRRDGKLWQIGLAGTLGALATLVHFIAIPPILVLGLILSWQRKWRSVLWFALPFLAGWAMWLLYAAQDWQSWWGQLALQFARKGQGGLVVFLMKIPFFQSFLPLYGVFPNNGLPLWFPLIVLSLWAWWRKHSPLTGWQVAFLTMTYFAATMGGELWYVGWFAPFGYLLLTVWLNFAHKIAAKRFWLVAFCIVLVSWQVLKVGQAISCVPDLKRSVDEFFAEVQVMLPKGAFVLLGSVPDPFPYLQRSRPDLRLIYLSPTPMVDEALKQVLEQAQFFVGVTKWWLEIKGNLAEPIKEWRFPTPYGFWSVGVYPLRKANSP